MQLGANGSSSLNQGRFALSAGGWAPLEEVVRIELNPNNETLRLIGNSGNQDFAVSNYNLGMGGSLLNVELAWDATTITLTVNNSVLGTTEYRNAGVVPDRFEFVAGWGSSSGIRTVTSTGVTVVPEPSTYALFLGLFACAWALQRRRRN